MKTFFLPVLAVLLLAATSPAQADRRDRDEHISWLHHQCDRGDRHACAEFGRLLEDNRDRHEEWRHSHPEFWQPQRSVSRHETWGSVEHLNRLHYECERGDRHACHEFRKVLEARHDRHNEWRHSHPEFWLWLRG